MKFCLLIFLAALYYHEVKASSNNTTILPSCADVQRKFVEQKIGPRHFVPQFASPDKSLQICPSFGPTCCTIGMEQLYKRAAVRAVAGFIKQKFLAVRTFLKDFASNFKYHLNGLKNRSTEKFHNIIASPLQKSLITTDLELYLTQMYISTGICTNDADIHINADDIEASIDRLLAFFLTINMESHLFKEQSTEVKDCVSQYSRKIVSTQSFSTEQAGLFAGIFNQTAAFVKLLNSALKLLDMNSSAIIDRQSCQDALVKMQFCSQCQQLTEATPCAGYCLNVLNGCLTGFHEYSINWNRYTLQLQNQGNKIASENRNIKSFLNNLAKKAEDIYNSSIKHDIIRSIKETCSIPQNRENKPIRRNVFSNENNDHSKKVVKTRKRSLIVSRRSKFRKIADIGSSIQTFIIGLENYRNIFDNTSENICQTIYSVDALNRDCWNGNTITDRYKKPIVQKDFESQHNNPEFEQYQLNPDTKNITYHINSRVLYIRPNNPIFKSLSTRPLLFLLHNSQPCNDYNDYDDCVKFTSSNTEYNSSLGKLSTLSYSTKTPGINLEDTTAKYREKQKGEHHGSFEKDSISQFRYFSEKIKTNLEHQYSENEKNIKVKLGVLKKLESTLKNNPENSAPRIVSKQKLLQILALGIASMFVIILLG